MYINNFPITPFYLYYIRGYIREYIVLHLFTLKNIILVTTSYYAYFFFQFFNSFTEFLCVIRAIVF